MKYTSSKSPKPFKLLEHLFSGKSLNRELAAKLMGSSRRATDRWLKHLRKLPGVQTYWEQRKLHFKFEWSIVSSFSSLEVLSVCFCAGMAKLFEGTSFGANIKKVIEQVLKSYKFKSKKYKFDTIDRKFLFLVQGGESSFPDKDVELQEILEYVLSQQKICFKYRKFDSIGSVKKIMPLSIAIYEHQFYVFGIDDEKKSLQKYRLSRMSDVNSTDEYFEYPTHVDYDPDDFMKNSLGIFSGADLAPEWVEIKLTNKWKQHSKTHTWHKSQKIIYENDNIILKIKVNICPELESFILRFGEEAVVLHPQSLVDKISSRIRTMNTLYPDPQVSKAG